MLNFDTHHTLGDLAERYRARIGAKVGDTTARVQGSWIETAMQSAKSGDYARSIQAEWPLDGDMMRGRVFSTAPYAAALEYGTTARDMKGALLSSPKAHVGKTGARYLSIPFRHGTPGTTTIPAMPMEIYEAARRLGAKGHLPPTPLGQRTKLPAFFRYPPGVTLGGTPAPYTWKTGLYSGMQKRGMKGHSQYMTFRTVSDNSDPSSWWYPGFAARDMRRRALATLVLPPGLNIS